jgi:hypothetical protein
MYMIIDWWVTFSFFNNNYSIVQQNAIRYNQVMLGLVFCRKETKYLLSANIRVGYEVLRDWPGRMLGKSIIN